MLAGNSIWTITFYRTKIAQNKDNHCVQHANAHRMIYLFDMLSELETLSISEAHLRSRDDLSASCCISFELSVQEEYNGAILEAVS